MKVFLAGIMQGSFQSNDVHNQSYRQWIASLVRRYLPDAEIVDPWALHPNSVLYDDDQAREVFFRLCEQAGQVDLMIAYVPEASNGTAIEIWEAHRHGVPVITVSPLVENWALRFLSRQICRSFEELESLLQRESLTLSRR